PLFSFSLRPPPPRSPLFPYTTLFRSFLRGLSFVDVTQATWLVPEGHRSCGTAPDSHRLRCDTPAGVYEPGCARIPHHDHGEAGADRKSTRLNSSHVEISYAVFCLKKK